MSRLVMSVVNLAMGLEAEQKCESCSDGGGSTSNNNMVKIFFFLFNPFININSSLRMISNLRVVTTSDRLSTVNYASDRK